MEKEVELILLKLKIVSEAQERGLYLCDKEHSKLLIDYITNLDEKNKELKKKITFNEKSRRKMQQSLMEQIEDYKSRIEKAIEYIENTPLYETTYDYNMEDELEIQNVSDETASNDLLNILRGKDNE